MQDSNVKPDEKPACISPEVLTIVVWPGVAQSA